MFREGQAPRPTKSEWDSADVKQAERLLKGNGVGAGAWFSAEKAVTATSCDRLNI